MASTINSLNVVDIHTERHDQLPRGLPKFGNSSDPSGVLGGKITTPNQAANNTRHPTKAPMRQNAGRIFETKPQLTSDVRRVAY